MPTPHGIRSKSSWQLGYERGQLLRRIERLEDQRLVANEPTSTGNRFLKWMGPALPSLISSAALLLFGYLVKDSVDLAIRQQQLQLSYVKEMQPLLQQLGHTGEGEVSLAGKEQIAILVAGFGESAVMPLANELRYAGNRLQSAEAGLRTLALTHSDAICRLLPPILGSAPPFLGWQGHQSASRILAAAQCVEAIALLQKHANVIKTPGAAGEAAVRNLVIDQPDVKNIKDWGSSIRASLAVLTATNVMRGRSWCH